MAKHSSLTTPQTSAEGIGGASSRVEGLISGDGRCGLEWSGEMAFGEVWGYNQYLR
jgi:hypothetical protein